MNIPATYSEATQQIINRIVKYIVVVYSEMIVEDTIVDIIEDVIAQHNICIVTLNGLTCGTTLNYLSSFRKLTMQHRFAIHHQLKDYVKYKDIIDYETQHERQRLQAVYQKNGLLFYNPPRTWVTTPRY